MFGPAMIFQKGSEGFNNKSNKPDGFCGRKATFKEAQELCRSRDVRHGLPVPNKPYSFRSCVKVCVPRWPPVSNKPDGFCGRKATFKEARELCKSRGGRPGLPVLNKPYGFCGGEM